MCYGLNNITINEELLIKFYKYVRSQGMEFLTADRGRDAMKYIDIYIEKIIYNCIVNGVDEENRCLLKVVN